MVSIEAVKNKTKNGAHICTAYSTVNYRQTRCFPLILWAICIILIMLILLSHIYINGAYRLKWLMSGLYTAQSMEKTYNSMYFTFTIHKLKKRKFHVHLAVEHIVLDQFSQNFKPCHIHTISRLIKFVQRLKSDD